MNFVILKTVNATSNAKLWFKAGPTIAAMILLAQEANSQNLVWANSYSGISVSALEETEGVLADNSGNVFVTGLSGAKGTASTIRTMKLDANGNVVWNVSHSRASLCGGMWGRTPLAMDGAGNLIVVGAEFNGAMDNWNPVLLKLSASTGTTLARWTFALGPYASFDAVVVDGADFYILAHNNPNNGNPHVVHTLKLASDGSIVWTDSFCPNIFWGTRGGIVVSSSRVCSAAGGRVMAQALNGDVLWEKEMSLPNGGSALAADGNGNIYLAEQNGVARLSPDGNLLGMLTGIAGSVSDLDIDASGNIYLVGSTASSRSGSDILVQKYSAFGSLVWNVTHGKNGPYSDDGIAITVRGGYLYVGGSKYNKNLDMCTLKYSAGN